jgi:abhydrolase domain-containing protein 13
MITDVSHVKRLQTFVKTLLLLSLSLTTLLCLVCYILQDNVMYIPVLKGKKHPRDNLAGRRHPSEVGLPCEDLFVTTSDGIQIHGWLLKQPNPKECFTLVSLHGNSGNTGHRIPNALQYYSELKCNVLQVEYRSFGHNKGTASEEGLICDVEAFLRTDLGVNKRMIVL